MHSTHAFIHFGKVGGGVKWDDVPILACAMGLWKGTWCVGALSWSLGGLVTQIRVMRPCLFGEGVVGLGDSQCRCHSGFGWAPQGTQSRSLRDSRDMCPEWSEYGKYGSMGNHVARQGLKHIGQSCLGHTLQVLGSEDGGRRRSSMRQSWQ